MFENITEFLKRFNKKEKKVINNSKEAAKERLHLVLMQDRANVSVDFLELMKQEIIDVIKKYIDIDEGAIDVRLTNKENTDGTNGAPALYANIPILNIKNDIRKINIQKEETVDKQEAKNSKQENDENKKTKNIEEEKEKMKEKKEKIEEKEEEKEEYKFKEKIKEKSEKLGEKRERKTLKKRQEIELKRPKKEKVKTEE